MAQCIYNKGCTADAVQTIPDYISTEGTLLVTSDDICEKTSLKYWNSIEVADEVCNDIEEELAISDSPYLESITVGSGSFKNVTQVSFTNLTMLNSFTVGEYAFENTNRVVVNSMLIFECLKK